jgi:nucleoid DNA-binding protein
MPSRIRSRKTPKNYRVLPIPDGHLTTFGMANLTKRDLVIAIADKTALTQQEVFSVIQLTLDGITEALANGKGVEFREFGVFTTRLTKQRVGRNPKKPAETVVIPTRAIVKFKSGKIMKARVLERTAQLST